MRLILGDMPDGEENKFGKTHPAPQYLVDEETDPVTPWAKRWHEMKVPSGYQSGDQTGSSI